MSDLVTLSDHALLIEIMTSDAAVAEDGSDAAAARQWAADAEGTRRWGAGALELTAQWAVVTHASSSDMVRIATHAPDVLFRVMGHHA